MSKKKKTRQQKIISDLRKKISLQTPSSPKPTITKVLHTRSNELKEKPSPLPIIHTPSPAILHSSYVYKDLMKTAILTSLLILGELLIFLAFRNKLFSIPGLSY